MLKTRKARGFSLVELLTVVIVLALLATVAMPNFVAAMQKSHSATVKGSMRTVQIAAESYLCNTDESYPVDCGNGPNGCGPFFPGGSGVIGGQIGAYPYNPITGQAAITPISIGLSTSASIQSQKIQSATSSNFPGGPGVVSYDRADGGNSYAICGGDANGQYAAGVGGTCLVLSNN